MTTTTEPTQPQEIDDQDILEARDVENEFVEINLEETAPRALIPTGDTSWERILSENFAGNIALAYEHDAAQEAEEAAAAAPAPARFDDEEFFGEEG